MSCRLPTILLYHHVVSGSRPDTMREPTSVALDQFAEQLEALTIDGWRFVPLEQMLARLCLEDPPDPSDADPELAVTFDDGYASLLDALPLLGQHGVPATAFVLTDLLGQTNLWNPKAFSIERHLTLEELVRLMREGLEIEFHGTDHQRLTKLSPGEIEQRFARGQDAFARYFGRRARAIAYPYGAFSTEVVDIARRFFDFGLAVDGGGWAGRASRFQQNRVEVQSWMTPELLVRLLSLEKQLRPRFLHEARTRTRLERLPR